MRRRRTSKSQTDLHFSHNHDERYQMVQFFVKKITPLNFDDGIEDFQIFLKKYMKLNVSFISFVFKLGGLSI